jgi:anhydro-N-acetylmuramic acid kinase
LIGSHGQTVFHQGAAVPFLGRPTRSTLQIGEGAVIAARTGVNVVSDFRVADMAVGGQGAPLVPYVDWMLFGDSRIGRVALNLGGIGNLTVLAAEEKDNAESKRTQSRRRERETQDPHANSAYGAPEELGHIDRGAVEGLPRSLHSEPRKQRLSGRDDGQKRSSRVLAFDTGPGNMVIDALVAHFTRGRKRFDEDGRIARQGARNEKLLAEMMKDPYLRVRPPKSTGREYYGAAYVERLLKLGRRFGAGPDDLVRAATIFTALTVVDALRRFVAPRVRIDEVIVSGGGAHNPVIMGQLAAALAPVAVMPSSELGVDVDAKEAFAFALLAHEAWHRRTGNLPSATGARRDVVLGKISFA